MVANTSRKVPRWYTGGERCVVTGVTTAVARAITGRDREERDGVINFVNDDFVLLFLSSES